MVEAMKMENVLARRARRHHRQDPSPRKATASRSTPSSWNSPERTMPLYFAYGSNMDRDAMAARCPASRPIGIGRLMRHRFISSRKATRRYARSRERRSGALCGTSPSSDMPALDRYESLSTGLYTKIIQPIVTAQGPRRAIVYVGRSAEAGHAEARLHGRRGRGGAGRWPARETISPN